MERVRFLKTRAYDRAAAVAYAHRWAYGRNPRYYDFENIGGDCTNFASQVLFAGSGIQNHTPQTGWYYHTSADRAPAWTGVKFLAEFLLQNRGVGPFAAAEPLDRADPGDLIRLQTAGHASFHHMPVVVAVGSPPTVENILVAAHSADCDNRPLSAWPIRRAELLHILGVRQP